MPPSQLVTSLIAPRVSGGDRCQDLAIFREDQALATVLGHALPAATTLRDFLEAFHGEDGPLWAAGPQAAIPLEAAPLAGLGQANRTLVAGLQRGARVRTATLDVDATLVENHKDAATVAYDGTSGYQRESRAAYTANAPLPLRRPPAHPTGSCSPENRPTGSGLAGN